MLLEIDLSTIDREIQSDHRLKSATTKRGYKHDVRMFERWRAGRPYSKDLIVEYKDALQKQGRAASGINRVLSAVRWWIGRLSFRASVDSSLGRSERVTWQLLLAQIKDIPNVPVEPPSVGRHLGRDTINTLLSACDSDKTAAGIRDAAIIHLAAATGLRVSELAGLDIADFEVIDQQEEGKISILGKGNKPRSLDVCASAFFALSNWLGVRGRDPGPLFYAIRRGGHIQTGKGMSTEALRQMLEKRCQQVGLAKIGWHDFRRTLVGDLLNAGIPTSAVQAIMGHSSPSGMSIYDKRPLDAVKRQAKDAMRFRSIPYCNGRSI